MAAEPSRRLVVAKREIAVRAHDDAAARFAADSGGVTAPRDEQQRLPTAVADLPKEANERRSERPLRFVAEIDQGSAGAGARERQVVIDGEGAEFGGRERIGEEPGGSGSAGERERVAARDAPRPAEFLVGRRGCVPECDARQRREGEREDRRGPDHHGGGARGEGSGRRRSLSVGDVGGQAKRRSEAGDGASERGGGHLIGRHQQRLPPTRGEPGGDDREARGGVAAADEERAGVRWRYADRARLGSAGLGSAGLGSAGLGSAGLGDGSIGGSDPRGIDRRGFPRPIPGVSLAHERAHRGWGRIGAPREIVGAFAGAEFDQEEERASLRGAGNAGEGVVRGAERDQAPLGDRGIVDAFDHHPSAAKSRQVGDRLGRMPPRGGERRGGGAERCDVDTGGALHPMTEGAAQGGGGGAERDADRYRAALRSFGEHRADRGRETWAGEDGDRALEVDRARGRGGGDGGDPADADAPLPRHGDAGTEEVGLGGSRRGEEVETRQREREPDVKDARHGASLRGSLWYRRAMNDRDATPPSARYAAAGVDLHAADDALRRIRADVESTYTPQVLRGLGAFGGLYALPGDVAEPVLVASTDGVGTKTRLALALGRSRDVGRDLVNHCINDVLVQGARPLFFLDYVAAARLDPNAIAQVVGGIAEACREAGVALLGGETAEMPGVYAPGELDVVGTIVGVVARAELIDGGRVRADDVLLALDSGGLQTNGFSLARAVASGHLHETLNPEDATSPTLGEALLAPHRSFLPAIRPLLSLGIVRGMAHVTGGGIPGNLPRALPEGLGAEVRLGSWPVPPVFARLQALGEIDDAEMRSVFNLGVGMIVIVAAEDVAAAQAAVTEATGAPLRPIGRVVAGSGVRFV
jgi:phosphoribosylformylglycinamidine cyclo-ligase